jgi:hypothetical protein
VAPGVALLGFLLASACAELTGPREAAYVQTPASVVAAMLRLAGVGPQDYVVDLGSGDGRIPIAAARDHGARGLGIDRDARLVEQSRLNAARAGVSQRVAFLAEDLFAADFSAATVVTLYLLPELNLRLRPRLLELPPGTRVVSHDFDMADWQPDRYVFLEAPDKSSSLKESRLYLWIVPAQIGGRWHGTVAPGAGRRAETLVLEVEQRFQAVSVVAWRDGVAWRGAGHVSGSAVSLDLHGARADQGERLRLSLRLHDGRLEGEVIGGLGRGVVRASRVAP